MRLWKKGLALALPAMLLGATSLPPPAQAAAAIYGKLAGTVNISPGLPVPGLTPPTVNTYDGDFTMLAAGEITGVLTCELTLTSSAPETAAKGTAQGYLECTGGLAGEDFSGWFRAAIGALRVGTALKVVGAVVAAHPVVAAALVGAVVVAFAAGVVVGAGVGGQTNIVSGGDVLITKN